MANFTSLAQYIASITARFNKPRRNLINEGILKPDIIEALSDAGKWAEDVRLESQAVNANFVARSLNLNAVVYLDGTNGNDSRTGATNDSNATTGRIKTMARAVELISGKCVTGTIGIYGQVDMIEDITFQIPNLLIQVNNGAIINFQKKTISGVTGEGTAGIIARSLSCNVFVYSGATINVENKTAFSSGALESYIGNQGAIRIWGVLAAQNQDYSSISIINLAGSVINVGDNATLLGNGGVFLPRSANAKAYIDRPTAITLGVAASTTRSFPIQGTFHRQYHPTSSTDVNITEGETVLSPTNNKLWTKRAGTIRDAMGTTFV